MFHWIEEICHCMEERGDLSLEERGDLSLEKGDLSLERGDLSLDSVAFQKPSSIKQGSDGSIQIHPTNNHWAVSHMENKQVFIYDSLNPTTLSEELSKQLCLMYGRGKENGATSVKLANIQAQSNGVDCGLYVVANATTIAFGEDPEEKLYKDKEMRQHLMQCFEAQILTPFPAHGRKRRKTKPQPAVLID